MQRALALAGEALWLTAPNPRVGCVITDPDGQVLGEGHTQAAGQAHAEIMALRDAQTRGHSVQGATAYVTLEPCAHHGRTGPCCDAWCKRASPGWWWVHSTPTPWWPDKVWLDCKPPACA